MRVQYERKKASIQLSRYDEGLELATKLETKELTLEGLCSAIKPYAETYTVNGKIDARILRYVYRSELGINIGYNKSYQIKTMLEMEEKQEKE